MARRRKPRNPESALADAQLLAAACPNARNRRRLHEARKRYAARVAPAISPGTEAA